MDVGFSHTLRNAMPQVKQTWVYSFGPPQEVLGRMTHFGALWVVAPLDHSMWSSFACFSLVSPFCFSLIHFYFYFMILLNLSPFSFALIYLLFTNLFCLLNQQKIAKRKFYQPDLLSLYVLWYAWNNFRAYFFLHPCMC